MTNHDTTTSPSLRELSRRTTGARVVSLVWDPIRGDVILGVDDLATGDRIRVVPTRGRERFAFEHPFAYMYSRHAAEH
jgi:hypothetical protein